MVQAIKRTGLILLGILVWSGCKKEKLVVGNGSNVGNVVAPDTFRNMMFIRLRLSNYLFTDTKGNKWDKPDGPDVFFVLKNSGKTLLRSEVVYNVPYTAFRNNNDTVPAVWRFTTPLIFENYMQDKTPYQIYFYDKDDTGDQFMFGSSFYLNSLEDPFLPIASFDANGLGQDKIAAHIDVKLY